jgi:hypothetical protein
VGYEEVNVIYILKNEYCFHKMLKMKTLHFGARQLKQSLVLSFQNKRRQEINFNSKYFINKNENIESQ